MQKKIKIVFNDSETLWLIDKMEKRKKDEN